MLVCLTANKYIEVYCVVVTVMMLKVKNCARGKGKCSGDFMSESSTEWYFPVLPEVVLNILNF